MASFMLHIYSEIVERAIVVEREMEEAKRLRNKNFNFGGLERQE